MNLPSAPAAAVVLLLSSSLTAPLSAQSTGTIRGTVTDRVTLPSSWGRFFRGSRWSFTLAGRNLAVWTKYKGRGDPEVQFNPNSMFLRLDYASTPQTRRLSAAVRVRF